MTPPTPIRVGDFVSYHAVIGGPVSSTGHRVNAIWDMPNDWGVPMAKISGKAGVVELDKLSKEREA